MAKASKATASTFLAGLCLSLSALGLLAPPAEATSSPKIGTGPVYFRQVICDAPAFTPPAATAAVTASSCAAADVLSPQNLGTTPSNSAPSGFSSNNVPPDAALASVPSTSPAAERADMAVLLPGLPRTGSPRFLLGPAQMTSSGTIASASVAKRFGGQWIVDYTMTARARSLWDRVARADFHRMLGIDVGGTVVSAPIIEPTQSSFSSFDGRGEISGSLTKSEATSLAHALTSGSHRR